MLYVFNRNEEVVGVLEKGNKGACPYYEAKIKSVLNGEQILTFRAPYEHETAKKIEEHGLIAVKNKYGKWRLFKITEIIEVHGDFLEIEVTAESSYVELDDVIIENEHIDRKTPDVALSTILNGTRWEVGTIEGNEIHDLTLKFKSVLEALQTFKERWNGELLFHIEIAGNRISKRLVDFRITKGIWKGKRLEYNKDIQEITRTVDSKILKTALYGIGNKVQTVTTQSIVQIQGETNPNLLTTAQINPSNINDLDNWSWGDPVTASISREVPTGLGESITRSYKIAVPSSTLYVEVNTSNNKTSITGGQTYTASVYVKTNIETTVSILLEYHDSNTNLNNDYERKIKIPKNTWQRISIKGKALNDANQGFITARMYNPIKGATMQATALKLEQGDKLSPIYIEPVTEEKEVQQDIPEEQQEPLSFSDIEWLVTNGDKYNKPLGQIWVGDEDARNKFGIDHNGDGTKEHLFGVFEISTDDPQELLIQTANKLDEVKTPNITYNVKAYDLYVLTGVESEVIELGDIDAIIDRDLDLILQARVIETIEDLDLEDQSEFTLGNFIPTLTEQDTETQMQDLTKKVGELENGEYLRKGEAIDPSWLNSEFSFARDQIRSGNGTVIMTEGEGILIVDDPANPQKAIKLQAGQIALANTRDLATGEFNWRNFGTGEGWLSDLVETGFLKFDRSQGGRLTLGGYDNDYGELIVYGSDLDSEGNPIDREIVTLNGNRGGFDRLSIGVLTETSNIVRKWYGGLIAGDESLNTFYVDVVNGNDNNDGTLTSPLKSIQGAVDKLPEYFKDEDIYIEVVNTDTTWIEEVNIKGLIGYGRLGIVLGARNILKGNIHVYGSMPEIYISTLRNGATTTANIGSDRATIQVQRTTYGVYAYNSRFVYCYDFIMNGNNLSNYGVYCSRNSYMIARYLEIYNTTFTCLGAWYGATLEIRDCSGQSERGLYSGEASHVGGTGRIPEGTIVQNDIRNGAIFNSSTFTPDRGSAPPVYEPVKTDTWTTTEVGSVWVKGDGTPVWTNGYAYQGKRPDDPPIWYGYFMFDHVDFSVLKNADGTTRPIQSVRLKIKRTNDTGENNARYPRFYTSNKTSRTGDPQINTSSYWNSGTGFTWGQEKWIDLSSTIAIRLRDGTADSIAIHRGSDEGNYMRFEGKATLEIVHG